MKGVITYIIKGRENSKEFFLEPSDGTKPFYSFIDGVLDKTKYNELCSVSFEPLNKETAVFELLGVDDFNRSVTEKNVCLEADGYKIGVNLLCSGSVA